MLTTIELRKKSVKELQKELTQARESSAKARIPVAMGQDKKSTESKKKQHYVARILTVINEPKKQEIAPDNVSIEKN